MKPFNRTLWNWNSPIFAAFSVAYLTFNRTLWNWNHRKHFFMNCVWILLIVPYGIETSKQKMEWEGKELLIVPYGIETEYSPDAVWYTASFNRTLWNWNVLFSACWASADLLLIVPYGIETEEQQKPHHTEPEAFNRTLWNWNERDGLFLTVARDF